ncbi:MAG TPA: ChbG/HpnK family deacetylase [Thermoanaerobaculia bacterium]|nr:ChbG/HpnK family deacetylase [Thermoanaerobaculia bacterium]
MKRLIVNADDFGRTPGVNDGTLEAYMKGIVTSATVMVLEPAAEEGIRLAAAAAPGLALGLHFAVTGGGPCASPAPSLPTLAPGGRFVRNVEELPQRIPDAEIRRELEAQIALFEKMAGRPPTHIDSHHHSALHVSIQPVFGDVAAEHGLPVRASNVRAAAQLREAGVRVPDRFIESFFGSGATSANLKLLLGHLRDGVSELMCHPGYPDEALLSGSSYAKEREQEIAALCDPSVREVLAASEIELVTFRELPA